MNARCKTMDAAKIYLIGNSHLDPVWLWRWQEGFAEIKATFQSALDRMEEFPGYLFTSACAAYYEWIEQNEPAMFAQIKKRVKEGRWCIVGGWYLQPDCNIPSGESFARHSLYGQRYFQEKFGHIAQVGYNVDSFGHNGGLPQILRQSGMNSYVFMRPMEFEKSMSANLFRWQGTDGSMVTAFRLPISYNSQREIEIEPEQRRLEEIAQLADREGADYMAFYGVGNHGGGATIQELRLLEEMTTKNPSRWCFSTPELYFKAQTSDALPIYRGDLQHHAPGCYSACSKVKADNRRAEHTLLTAEQLCTTAGVLFGLHYPYEEFLRAWKSVMFNQFHDILGGCCIREAYEDAAALHGEALAIGERAINFSLQKLSWNIDTTNGIDILRDKHKDWKLWEDSSLGTPIVIYNPLSWEVTAPVVCSSEVNYVTDCEGNVLPSQKTRASQTNCNDNYETVFLATIPAFGYTVCRVFKHAEAPAVDLAADYSASNTHMENEYLRVEIDPTSGCISRLYRKDLGLELLQSKSSAQVMDETNYDTWAHGADGFHEYVGCFGGANVRLIESGPVRCVIRANSTFASSSLRQDFILTRGSRQVDVKVQINWQEKHKVLKLAFPVNVTQPRVTADTAYAHIERVPEGKEDPCQQWVDLYGYIGETPAGLALLNDCKYGYDAKDNVLRMTAVRSPIYANDQSGERDELCEFMDQGIHKFRYSICPHSSNFTAESLVKRAYELNIPPRAIIETFHRGSLPVSMTGIYISSKNIIATALKNAEDKNGYILRCYETDGISTETTIELPLFHQKWRAQFHQGEIKTFYIPKEKTQTVYETNLLEELMA